MGHWFILISHLPSLICVQPRTWGTLQSWSIWRTSIEAIPGWTTRTSALPSRACSEPDKRRKSTAFVKWGASTSPLWRNLLKLLSFVKSKCLATASTVKCFIFVLTLYCVLLSQWSCHSLPPTPPPRRTPVHESADLLSPHEKCRLLCLYPWQVGFVISPHEKCGLLCLPIKNVG